MDASTGTCSGKLSTTFHDHECEEMCMYVEATERMINRSKLLIELDASGDKNCKLPIRKSLFAHVPPYIVFQHYNKKHVDLPPEITKYLLWKDAKTSGRMIWLTVIKSGYTITKRSDENWSGTWSTSLTLQQLKTLKNFQKINHFPDSSQLSHKDLLWRNYNRMVIKFGRKDFGHMPMTYVFPEESIKFRRLLEKRGGTWIVKPPASCAGRGIRVISRWCEIPKNQSLIIQRYLSEPKLIDGFKFDMRLYVLVTNFDPLLIYLYSEGLVRFATAKYFNDVSFLFDRYMHLTNTSVNKFHPRFEPNDSVDKCSGNMWSLNSLWSYFGRKERVNIPRLWKRIKDIAIKTIVSAELSIVESSKAVLSTSYNCHQLFGFDVILDERFKPWLLEVNSCPSMDPDTPLCSIVKGQLAKDYLNIIGFQIPNLLRPDEMKTLTERYDQSLMCYDHQLYDTTLTTMEKEKQIKFSKISCRNDYLKTIIKDLTPNDVRVLIRYEDQIAETGRFEKIFPTSSSYKYLKYFEEARYYNMLLDAWENTYCSDRAKGILRLQKLCRKKFHLVSTENVE